MQMEIRGRFLKKALIPVAIFNSLHLYYYDMLLKKYLSVDSQNKIVVTIEIKHYFF